METARLVHQFIVSEFLSGSTGAALPEELNLLQSGIVDSLGLLKVIAFLEEQLGVSVPPEAMTPENFASIRAIVRLVDSFEPRSA